MTQKEVHFKVIFTYFSIFSPLHTLTNSTFKKLLTEFNFNHTKFIQLIYDSVDIFDDQLHLHEKG